MNNWFSFWQNYRKIKINNEKDLLYQVGKTVGGQVIPKRQYDILITEIIKNLNLNSNDKVLDLCCGNGIVTYELAKHVSQITGIDFSKPMIENAVKYRHRNNINYVLYDINNIENIRESLEKQNYNKFLLYDCLAYFNRHETYNCLKFISTLNSEIEITILISSILDKSKKWKFFNTTKRKLNYFFSMKFLGFSKGLGKWWSENELIAICEKLNLKCTFFKHNSILYTSHYRNNVLIIKNNDTF